MSMEHIFVQIACADCKSQFFM